MDDSRKMYLPKFDHYDSDTTIHIDELPTTGKVKRMLDGDYRGPSGEVIRVSGSGDVAAPSAATGTDGPDASGKRSRRRRKRKRSGIGTRGCSSPSSESIIYDSDDGCARPDDVPRGAATVDPSELSESFLSASRCGSDAGSTAAGYISDHGGLDCHSTVAESLASDGHTAGSGEVEELSSSAAEADVDSEGSPVDIRMAGC